VCVIPRLWSSVCVGEQGPGRSAAMVGARRRRHGWGGGGLCGRSFVGGGLFVTKKFATDLRSGLQVSMEKLVRKGESCSALPSHPPSTSCFAPSPCESSSLRGLCSPCPSVYGFENPSIKTKRPWRKGRLCKVHVRYTCETGVIRTQKGTRSVERDDGREGASGGGIEIVCMLACVRACVRANLQPQLPHQD